MDKTGINIVILGKTGVGKSSFCNYIFNKEVFTTGTGRPVTGWEKHFKHESVEHEKFTLNIYDSVGIEPDNYEKWQNLLDKFLYENGPHSCNPPMQWLHAAIYLINAASARVEPVELGLLKSLARQKIPTQIVLTNCDSASQEKIDGIKNTILAHQKNASITEACSVSIKKRSGTSAPYGKEETINTLIRKLDTDLRNKIISYALDKQAAAIRQARDHMIEKIDDSKLGLLNIIKGVIQDGDSFDFDEIINFDIDLDDITEQYQQFFDELDSFLMDLGFASGSDDSTAEALEAIQEQISCDMDAIGSKMEDKLNGITNAFDSDSLWEKTKAVAQIGNIAIDLKGFMKKTINEACDYALLSIDKHKPANINS